MPVDRGAVRASEDVPSCPLVRAGTHETGVDGDTGPRGRQDL